LAGTLKKWCKKKKPIMQQLDNIQNQIRDIQMLPIQVQDHNLEAGLIAQYEENMTKLTEFYRQRAKKHWATRGIKTRLSFIMRFLNVGAKIIFSPLMIVRATLCMIQMISQRVCGLFSKYLPFIYF